MQSITVIFMWGEHHLAHVRHSCWCQVSTGFLIIRSRNLYRCLHGFMCDKTAQIKNKILFFTILAFHQHIQSYIVYYILKYQDVESA